jgi:hypothetical protein
MVTEEECRRGAEDLRRAERVRKPIPQLDPCSVCTMAKLKSLATVHETKSHGIR